MTTIDYTGAFIQEGEPDPVMDQMNVFLKEHVNFDDQMPKDVRSWKQNSKIVMEGKTAIKTTIRSLRMKDGS